jgi:hypothetical protein
MWIDAHLATRGYAHAVGRAGARLGRIAADLWEHFTSGNRTTLLDVAAWHAVARADRVVGVHPDGSATTVVAAGPGATVAAVRAAADAESGTEPVPFPTGRLFVSTVDNQRLTALVGSDGLDGSVAMLVDGTAGPPWTSVEPADLIAALTPDA